MFNFTQLCEFETRHGHSWFWFSRTLLNCVSDKGDIWTEDCHDGLVRVWFPSQKYFDQLETEQFKRLINEAIEKQDWKLVKQLQERYKK